MSRPAGDEPRRSGDKARLLVVGAGGHGFVVADAADETGFWTDIVFLDDNHKHCRDVCGWPVLGPIDAVNDLRDHFDQAIVAIGDNAARLAIHNQFAAAGIPMATVVHPGACLSGRARLDAGSVMLANSSMNGRSAAGPAAIINTNASVDHDCTLGDGVHVAPGAHVGGTVFIGDRSLVGTGASVRAGIRIGNGATVGAGAAVVADVGDNSTVVGVPARTRGDARQASEDN